MTKQIKIIVEKHDDGFVAYPIGIEGVVIGEGSTYDEALNDVRSAIKFHIETFGKDAISSDPEILEAYLTETGIEI
jgi:predicted RNase H-like HicB family nuclease